MLDRRIAGITLLIVAVVALLGCPTPPKSEPMITQLPGATSQRTANLPASEPPAEIVLVPRDPTLAPPASDPGFGEGLHLPTGYLPIPIWFELCEFTDVRVVQKNYPQTVELENPNGILTLTLGQRFAKWNGLNIGFGFPPTIDGGQFSLNSLDVVKNVYPLATRSLAIGTNRVLVIDAGHGGTDGGAKCSTKNVWEKDLALDWALRVEQLLTNSNWKVFLTRRDDREVPLMNRVALADTQGADLFISLHFNSSGTSASAREDSGIETYCVTPTGMQSHTTRGFDDSPGRVFTNNRYDMENILVAARMQESMLKATGRRDRGVRRARFMTVLREQNRPAVLLEGGFLSNPTEADLILQPEFRQKLAEAVVQALPQ